MFHTHVARVCPKYFICFKFMLHSSVSCCKCRPPALVSTSASRAKPWPSTPGGGVGGRRWCGEEAQAAWCCCGRDGGESSKERDSWSEAGSSDASMRKGAGADDTRIWADGAEQPGASAAVVWMPWSRPAGRLPPGQSCLILTAWSWSASPHCAQCNLYVAPQHAGLYGLV
jgi:hypothetical protein